MYIISEQFNSEACIAAQQAKLYPEKYGIHQEFYIDVEDPNFHTLLNTYAKPKGATHKCPRDGGVGCALVDALQMEKVSYEF